MRDAKDVLEALQAGRSCSRSELYMLYVYDWALDTPILSTAERVRLLDLVRNSKGILRFSQNIYRGEDPGRM